MAVELNDELVKQFHQHLADLFVDNVWEEIKDYANGLTEDTEEYHSIREFLSKNTKTVEVR